MDTKKVSSPWAQTAEANEENESLPMDEGNGAEKGQSLRLLHVISSVNPEGGGPIEGVRQLASIYRSRSIGAEVVSLDEPNQEFVREFPLAVHCLGPTAMGRYRYSRQLYDWLCEHHARYDCVIVNGIWQYHGFATWLALRNTKTPYVVFPHGMLDPWFKRRYPWKHLKKWLYWPWAEYRVLRDAKAVFFTSEEEKRLAAESFWLYRNNSIVVGYGTRRPRIDAQAEKQKFLAQFPELRGKRLITFVGRIHPKKGCDLLLRAFAQTLAAKENWHLVMVGPDQVGWQAELVKLSTELGIHDRVTWTGMLQGDSKWAAFAAMDVFVLPSHQENFGIVVSEALACGKPVLISNKVNIWREVRSEAAGLVADDTLEGTIELLQGWGRMSEEERTAMAARALPCFTKHFDLETSAGTLLNFVASAAQNNGRVVL